MADAREYTIELIIRSGERSTGYLDKSDDRHFNVEGMTAEQYLDVHKRIQNALADVASELVNQGYLIQYVGVPPQSAATPQLR